jgi:hypothetical protein
VSEQTEAPTSKADLLERLRTRRAEWDALAGQIPETVLTQPVLDDGSSVKDLIAHVAAYENWMAAQIRAANEARAPTNRELYGVDDPPPALSGADGWDLDRQNAAIYAQHKDVPLSDVQAFSARAFQDLLAAIAAVSEDDLARPGAQSWAGDSTLLAMVADEACGHYDAHIDALRTITGQDTV